MSVKYRHFRLCSGLVAIWIAGCGSQQFSPETRELLNPLQTAVSAKKSEWIDATEKKVLAEREAGHVSDSELKALSAIIQKTRAGDWKQAQVELNSLVDSQRPTAADIAQLKSGERTAKPDEHRKKAVPHQKR